MFSSDVSKVFRNDVVTTGAVFPLLLTDFPTGMTWFNVMAKNPNVQTLYGTVEAFNSTGSIAPLLTWDTKITVALAMIDGATQFNCTTCVNCDGNIAKHIGNYLKRDGLYDRFYNVTKAHYNLAPGLVAKSDVPFALPHTFVHSGL
jgi:hypothetical protein